MKAKLIIYFGIGLMALALFSCKKTRLSDGNAQLTGTWRWIGGYLDQGSTDLRLDLLEKGKYKLYKGSKKIEYGRLVQDGAYLEFVSDNLLKHMEQKRLLLDKQNIFSFKNDTLNVYKAGTFDGPGSTFVKE